MFRAWIDFAFASAQLCQEAQEVVALRLTKIAGGGVDGHTEAQRMVAEKGFALAEAVVTLSVGGSMQKVLRHYQGHVRANKRRLSRAKRR
jgi:hypothetical protein